MKEIGGYLAFPEYKGKMLYKDGILLNSGRNCLEYLIKEKNIKKLFIPYYLCDCVEQTLKNNNVEIQYYHIKENFYPNIEGVSKNEWLLVVNYYGIISTRYLKVLSNDYKLIVDNTQNYFTKPIKSAYTIYSCRKYFGVADGGVLFGNVGRNIYDNLSVSVSYDNMKHLLGRFEKSASEYYSEFKKNEKRIESEEIKQMSSLTKNILHSLNYKKIKKERLGNFKIYLKELNKLNETPLSVKFGTFAYPFMHKDAEKIKEKLIKQDVYIPTLWPNCLLLPTENIEYKLAKNVLPLPCSQDCKKEDINKIIQIIKEELL